MIRKAWDKLKAAMCKHNLHWWCYNGKRDFRYCDLCHREQELMAVDGGAMGAQDFEWKDLDQETYPQKEMKLREVILLIAACTLVLAYIGWYAFTFIDPLFGLAVAVLYFLILIYLPYNKIKNK